MISRTWFGLHVTRSLAVLVVVAGALLLPSAAASASTINCFVSASAADYRASPFVNAFCAFPADADTNGGGAGHGGASLTSGNGSGGMRRPSGAGSNATGAGSNATGVGSRATGSGQSAAGSGSSPSIGRGQSSTSSQPAASFGQTIVDPASTSHDGGGVPALGALVSEVDPANDLWRNGNRGNSTIDLRTERTPSQEDTSADLATSIFDEAGHRVAGDGPGPGLTVFPAAAFSESLVGTDPSDLDFPALDRVIVGSSLGAVNTDALAVPEPGALALLGIGLVALLALRRP